MGCSNTAIAQTLDHSRRRSIGAKYIISNNSTTSQYFVVYWIPRYASQVLLFVKTDDVRLGQDMEWHFRERRNQLLISLVMEGWPDSARHGEPICANQDGEWPTFVYAYMAPFSRAMPACLVRVHRCVIFPDGSVDVNVRVRGPVWLERAWERPISGRLFEVTHLRMRREEA